MNSLIFVLHSFSPRLAVTCGVLPQTWCDQTDFNAVIGLIANWLIGLIGGILAIVILVSAIQIITSAGAPDRIKSAKERITQAAISLALLISFRVILGFFAPVVNGTIKTSSLDGVGELITYAAQLLSYLVGALAVIMIIVGGIQYITSGGSSDRVSSAKKTILYAIVGVILALSINVIITTIHTVFGI